ncbi:MAG: adenylyltransferase/cytidyltransferase family protein, partial [Verrucomicrobiota bacterium]
MPESMGKRCAIFGGSFDPLHLGHLGMAKRAVEFASLEEIVFVPCFVSPFKSGTVASGPQRAEMIRLGLSDDGIAG